LYLSDIWFTPRRKTAQFPMQVFRGCKTLYTSYVKNLTTLILYGNFSTISPCLSSQSRQLLIVLKIQPSSSETPCKETFSGIVGKKPAWFSSAHYTDLAVRVACSIPLVKHIFSFFIFNQNVFRSFILILIICRYTFNDNKTC
jgi:hypothetical protein